MNEVPQYCWDRKFYFIILGLALGIDPNDIFLALGV
jgi:hypothetical protein